MSPAVHLVTAPSEVDHASVDGFVEALADAPVEAVVEVDCSGVAFMDSAGVRALSMAAQRQEAAGGEVRVVRPTAVVRRILEVTSLDSLISEDGPAPPP